MTCDPSHQPFAENSDEALLRFWSLALQLKRVRRQGWIDRGVADPESSADHSWGVALLGWALASRHPDLDRDRVMLLALVHDLPEAVAGDTTPFDTVRDEEGVIPVEQLRTLPEYSESAKRAKVEAEATALQEMLAGLPAELANQIRSAWEEYEHLETAEARFVRQIDKLETLLQAESYLRDQPELVIDSFRLGTRRDVTDPHLVDLLRALGQPETQQPTQ